MTVSAGIVVSLESPLAIEEIKHFINQLPGCKIIFVTVKPERLYVVTETEQRRAR